MPDQRAPEPTRVFFDPFNSSSTGHQTHASALSGSTAWRESRTRKLAHQLADTSGRGGQNHISDTVGAGSATFGTDGRNPKGSWERGASGLREKNQKTIADMMNRSRKRKVDEDIIQDKESKKQKCVSSDEMSWPGPTKTAIPKISSPPTDGERPESLPNEKCASPIAEATAPSTKIFRGLTLYINGSTHASGVSDHYLKSLFVQNGGSLSIALGRRTVTHVIVGTGKGLLAAGKIQKEVTKVRGKGIKYVTAKWVIDSVENGKRLPETRYQGVHVAMKGQMGIGGKTTS